MTAQSQIVNNPSRLRAHSLGNDAPELAQYQDEPAQMHSGAVGKSGYLRLGFEQRGKRCNINTGLMILNLTGTLNDLSRNRP